MSAQIVVRTQHLRLFKLARPSQPWDIYLLEGAPPETAAWLQALYSRSPLSIETRLREMAERERRTGEQRLAALRPETRLRLARLLGFDDAGALERLDPPAHESLHAVLAAFEEDLAVNGGNERDAKAAELLRDYYVGYGHRSIGDLANVLLFIEGVPLHLPTQIQDSPLYNGQECSTRYLNMSAGRRWNPLENALGAEIQDAWLALYERVNADMRAALSASFPFVAQDGWDPKIAEAERKKHARAINARAFDVARGFLAVGCSTSYSWSTNVRQANDHLRQQRQHPDPLVRAQANDLLTLLTQRYPASFSHVGRPETDAWLREVQQQLPYQVLGSERTRLEVRRRDDNTDRFNGFLDLLRRRPSRAEIIGELASIAEVTLTGQIDYGSFRDLHRHRSCRIPIPHINPLGNIHSWYLDALTPDLRTHVEAVLQEQRKRLQRLEGDPFLRQAYGALGTLVPYELRGPLGPFVYILELRSKADVHATVRQEIHAAADQLPEQFPPFPVTIDRTPDRFYLKRGEQTIIDRKTGDGI